MNRISDEKLEKLLSDYYDSEPPVTLTFRRESDRAIQTDCGDSG